MTTMRAKLIAHTVIRHEGGAETINFRAVGSPSYPSDGSDEDNTYAKFTPQAELSMVITNPELKGKFEPGDTFYVDFTPANP